MSTVNNNSAGTAVSAPDADAWNPDTGGAGVADSDGFLSRFSAMFSNSVKVKKGALDDALKKVTADASDPEALAKYQAALAEYTLYRNAQSNAVKAYKDVDANTIRNFN